MNMRAFSDEFGACDPWPYPTEEANVAGVVNQRRAEGRLPRFLDGRMTTWGWFKSGGGPTETDWSTRAEALRLSLSLYKTAQAANLRLSSEAEVPYTPLVAHLGSHGDFLARLKSGLGIDSEEPAEVEVVPVDLRAQVDDILPYDLFFGSDAVVEGVDKYFDAGEVEACRTLSELLAPYSPRRVRFDVRVSRSGDSYLVCPVLVVGQVGNHVAGLWSYEVRT